MKQPYGNALPAAPTRGDSCFRDDGTLHFCYTDGVWTQISGGASAFTDLTDAPASYVGQAGNVVSVNPGETGLQFSPAGGTSRLEYGTAVVVQGDSTNCIRIDFPPEVNRHAADMYNHPGEYFGKCKFDVFEITGGTPASIVNSWLGQSFANIAALYAFILANFIPGSGPGRVANWALIKWYDEIDDTYPQISKIWGINKFYSMLRGREHYRDSIYCLTPECIRWNRLALWFEDLCNQNVGFGPGHTYNPNDEKAIWVSRNEKKMYGLPRAGFTSFITSAGDRRIWDWGSSSFDPLPVPVAYVNTPSWGLPLMYCHLDVNTVSWRWDPVTNYLFMYNTSRTTSSTVVLYAMESSADPNHRSLFLKPLGIDRLGFNWFDRSIYDLYGLYTRKNTSPIIRQLAGIAQETASRDFVWVNRPGWDVVALGPQARLSKNMVGLQPWTTQFFLRDKTTKKISRVSVARVVRSQRHYNAPFKYEVRR